MTARGIRAIALAAVALTTARVLSAHPTADTSVVITIDDARRVTVSVSADARALALKTEALGGSQAAHLDLRLDGQPVALTASVTGDVPGRSGFVALEFTGLAPASSRRLTFRTIAIAGTYPLLVRHTRETELDGDDRYEWIGGSAWSRVYDLDALGEADGGSTLGGAVALGFTHIVPKGLDHILFVLGLFLLSSRARAIVAQVTAFTAAHSVTLALGAAGVVSMPAAIVEPLIALSIVYVGAENLRSTSLGRGRLAVVFAFGLLHGLGFAEALSSLRLSSAGWLATLVGFNIGVELGQLAVIGTAAIALARARVRPDAYRAWIVRPASLAIAAAGVVWMVERAWC